MLQKDPSKRMSVAGVLAHTWTSLPPEKHRGASKKIDSLLGSSVASQEESSTGREKLAAAAREAIETARQAASEAERAAAAAREAETTAAAALAAAADAAASRTASLTLAANGAKSDSTRGDGVTTLGSPRGGFIPEWGQKITRLFGRQSSLGGGGVKSTKDVEADSKAATGRSSPATASRRPQSTHSASSVGGRERAWSGDSCRMDSTFKLGGSSEGDAGASRSASMSASLAGRQYAPSHTYGLEDADEPRGELHYGGGGIFETTKASVGSATVAARRKLLRRSSSTTAPSDKSAGSVVNSGCKLVRPTSATAPTKKTDKSSPRVAGQSSSVRARAHRASVNFGLLPSLAKEHRDGEGESNRSSTRPIVEHSLSSVFAATSSDCVTGTNATLENDGGVTAALSAGEMVTAVSSPPSSAGGVDSSRDVDALTERDIAFDVVAGPASGEDEAAAAAVAAAAVSPSAAEVASVDDCLEKSGATTANQLILPSLSTTTTMSASPSPEDEAPIAASDYEQEKPRQEEQGRPKTPLTSAVSLEDALPPNGLEQAKLSISPCSSSDEKSDKTSQEISAETSVEKSDGSSAVKSVECPLKQSPGSGSSEQASQAADFSSRRLSADPSTDASAEASTERTPEPAADRSVEAMVTESFMCPAVEPKVEESAEPKGGLSEEKSTELPAALPTKLPAPPSPPMREVDLLPGAATTATPITSASTSNGAVVEVLSERPVDDSAERTATSTSAATAVAGSSSGVAGVAVAAATGIATAVGAIASPGKDKTTKTAAVPDKTAEPSANQSPERPSRRKRAMASRLPPDEEAAFQNKESVAKSLAAATATAAVSPGPGRGTSQGRSSSLRGRRVPSRSTSPRGRSLRGRSPKGRGRSLSPMSMSQSMSQEFLSQVKPMSRSQEASSPLTSMSMLEEESSSSSLRPGSTSAKISIMTQSAASSATQPTIGDRTIGAEAELAGTPADAEGTGVLKKDGEHERRWSEGVGEDPNRKTETVRSDGSSVNNLRERVEEENIWVAAATGNGDAVRHRASGRYRRGAGRGSPAGSEAASEKTAAPSSGPTQASGGVIAAAVAAAARAKVETSKAASKAAVPASGVRDPAVVTVEAKKVRTRGKGITRTVARMFGRRDRGVASARSGGGGQGLSVAKSS